jgi:cyanophycin synthetase
MKLVERRLLRGPNVHSNRPCCMAVIDLESLDEVSSTQIEGFVDRPVTTLTSLMLRQWLVAPDRTTRP